MVQNPESTNVGHCLRTSRVLNNSIIFTRAPKVRRTFNIMSPFPGEGGKGDGRCASIQNSRAFAGKRSMDGEKWGNTKTKSMLQRMG